MNTDDIRQAYLKYFENKGHVIVPSSSLIPQGDPTLLLTTAGMVQFKPYFQSLAIPPSPRMTSCQKCFRTTDLDLVGDYKHLTFFEMLGNFSIGDYFKREAILWAWEFVTQTLKIKSDELWVTVYLDDDEAYNHWREIGIPEDKIVRLGEKFNFWGPAGLSGPCGPCSEIHYDFGVNTGCKRKECGPDCDCGRFTEIWNLVFTQFDQSPDGKRTPLPKPNIDTGMGLERTATIMQKVHSVYDTDNFLPLRKKLAELSGKVYGEDKEIDYAIRIISEHSRGLTFLIADGVMPSNEGRGYILRRILRKASFLGRKLNMRNPFLSEMSDVVIQIMGTSYPELQANYDLIKATILAEEEKFVCTIDAGMNLVDKALSDIFDKGEKKLDGKIVFKLYDTYGFPPDLTNEIAIEKGLAIDLIGFESAMKEQRDKARASHKFITVEKGATVKKVDGLNLVTFKTRFSGYDEYRSNSKILYIIDQQSGEVIVSADKNKKVAIVLDKTPFYAEKGGQIGDSGKIYNDSLHICIETAVYSPYSNVAEGAVIHLGYIEEGVASLNLEVTSEIDVNRRFDIARNHTATHLLQAVLKQVLGSHVRQRGSLVVNDRFRFDFSHTKVIEQNQIDEIQSLVNEKIRQNISIISEEDVPYQHAIMQGATALLDEKYSEKVRILRIGVPAFSTELCGGTHVKCTGEIGLFLITNESSIGTGLRRIEAVTGQTALAFAVNRLRLLNSVAGHLKVSPSQVDEKVGMLTSELNLMHKQLAAYEKELSKDTSEALIRSAIHINGITVIATKVNNSSVALLRDMGDNLKKRLKSAVIVLGTIQDEKPAFVSMITSDLVKKGLHAGEIAKQISLIAGGSGGGKAEIAQSGGRDKEKIDEALAQVSIIVEKSLIK